MKYLNRFAESPLRILTVIFGSVVIVVFSPFFSSLLNAGSVGGMIAGAALVFLGFFGLTPRRVWKAYDHGTKKVLCRIAVLLVLIGLIWAAAVSAFIAFRAASAPPENEMQTVILLGCYVRGETPGIALRQRMDTAIGYLQAHPASPCILCGGQGKGEAISEAEAMRRYLVEAGIDPKRLYLEDRSTDTEENLKFAKQIIEEENLPTGVALVTQNYHQGRAWIEAKTQGLTAYAVTAPCKPLVFPTYFVRELFGVTEYVLLRLPIQLFSSAESG